MKAKAFLLRCVHNILFHFAVDVKHFAFIVHNSWMCGFLWICESFENMCKQLKKETVKQRFCGSPEDLVTTFDLDMNACRPKTVLALILSYLL